MNYAEVLKRAGQIIWKYKVLWIFGILASCGQGGGGGSGGSGSSNYNGNYDSGTDFLPPQAQQWLNDTARYLSENWWIIALLIMLLCVIFIAVMFLSTIGKIALIKGTLKAEAGAERMGFGELFSESMPYFWRVFLFSLLSGLVLFVATMILILPVIALTVVTLGLALLCMLPFLCLFIPLSWAIAVILEQATIAIIVDNTGILDGLSRGWDVVKRNPVPMIVMGLILFLGSAVVGLILAVPIFAIVLAGVLPLMLGGDQGMMTVLYIALTCVCLYLPFLLVANGVIMAYVQSAWTLTYLRLTGGKQPEEIFTTPMDTPAAPLDTLDA